MSIILITGANRGIGLELTRQYAHGGWQVLACCRSPENVHALHELAARCNHEGDAGGAPSIHIYPLDVTSTDQRASLAARLQGLPIDILCNNAGISGNWDTQGFGLCRADEWLSVLHANVIGPMLMIQDFVENVAASERRIIANMSSRIGSIANADTMDGRYLYRSSKSALNMISAICAGDLAARGITVVALHPGWARTDMGGPNATLSVEKSAGALRANLAAITFSDSGRFMDIDGGAIAW